MIKLCRMFLALAVIIVCPVYGCGAYADDEGDTYMINGQITSMDSIGRIIVVKWMQSYPAINYDHMTLKVPEDLQIMKGTDVIGFCDVNQFDRVTVQYQRRSIGLPSVTSMTINNEV